MQAEYLATKFNNFQINETRKDLLLDEGFSHYKLNIGYSEIDRILLLQEFAHLEKDPYANEKANRFRRYGNGIILPWSNKEVHWIPTVRKNGVNLSGYDQGTNNPEHDNVRYFNSLSEKIKKSNVLNDIVIDDFNNTFWPDDGNKSPIYFGVHFVKLSVSSKYDEGVSSPNCFHQDGEPFTFAHLIKRSHGVVGGVNHIGPISFRDKFLNEIDTNHIIKSFTLNDFFDSFAVRDSEVTHHVEPITKHSSDKIPVERYMILVDFSRMRQVI